jgi:hypothetical protein
MASWSVSMRMRRRSVRRTAAKLDAAIFWKIVITKPSARPFALPLGEREAVLEVLLERRVERALLLSIVNDSVWTQRRAKSGEPSGRQASALVRRNTTEFRRCRFSTMSSGLLNSVGFRSCTSIQKRK